MSEPVDPDEVIPPSRQSDRPHRSEHSAAAHIVARWFDELFKIPGTNQRIGLDPLISLVPGVGDFISSFASFVVLLEAVRLGVGFSVIVHMAFNIVVNALLDMIPGAGPALSIFFRSNSRNLELLRRWQAGQHRRVRRGSRITVALIVLFCFLVLAALVAVWIYYFGLLAHWLGWT
jgi:hypothetical protein